LYETYTHFLVRKKNTGYNFDKIYLSKAYIDVREGVASHKPTYLYLSF